VTSDQRNKKSTTALIINIKCRFVMTSTVVGEMRSTLFDAATHTVYYVVVAVKRKCTLGLSLPLRQAQKNSRYERELGLLVRECKVLPEGNQRV
jgi:hypothetical protein